MQLEKAKLRAIKADGSFDGAEIPVQFNPSSLSLQIVNETEGGESRGKQVRQYTGSSSTTLTVDLIFDTADEGTTESPRSVREKTSELEQFVYPRGEGDNKQAPPRLRFEWGDLVLEGVVESLDIDLDHFAPNGFPLRAKVGFSFREQDARYELLAAGPGANAGFGFGASFSAGVSLGVVGSIGVGVSAQVGLAIGGESAAEFAARVGVDPAAWRGLSFDASASLSLEAGVEVGFSANLNANAGVGVFTGASAGADVWLEASFGLEANAGVTTVASAGANAQVQQSFTLAAAGGVGAAVESVKINRSEAAAGMAKQAFAGAALLPAGGGRPAMPEQPRTPLTLSGTPTIATQAAPVAPVPPRADVRASSFGFGVPLRPIAGTSATLRERSGAGSVPVSNDPTTPLWVALPVSPRYTPVRGRSRPKTPRECGCKQGSR